MQGEHVGYTALDERYYNRKEQTWLHTESIPLAIKACALLPEFSHAGSSPFSSQHVEECCLYTEIYIIAPSQASASQA